MLLVGLFMTYSGAGRALALGANPWFARAAQVVATLVVIVFVLSMTVV